MILYHHLRGLCQAPLIGERNPRVMEMKLLIQEREISLYIVLNHTRQIVTNYLQYLQIVFLYIMSVSMFS